MKSNSPLGWGYYYGCPLLPLRHRKTGTIFGGTQALVHLALEPSTQFSKNSRTSLPCPSPLRFTGDRAAFLSARCLVRST